jgi:transcriptional regulator with XRE-family HTH domain
VKDGDVELGLQRISERVRRWRDEAGLTLQELARKSDVATSTIQKIETARMIPSVAVLLKVARGLGRRPSELIGEGDSELEIVHLRPEERHPVGLTGRVVVERLTGDLSDPALETWRVTLHPGQASGRGTIHYDGEELVVCEAGSVTFRLGDGEHVLRAGDTLHFKAAIPHSWRNEGQEPAVFTVTGTLPRQFRAVMRGRLAAPETQGTR